jgi:Holliday junction resolvasome RuvABC endonuclease subunit
MVNGYFLSIDPGAISGAYALFFAGKPVKVGDLPVVDGQLDGAELGRMVAGMELEAAVVERVASMPKQGVASTFRFGMAVGIIHGVVLANEVPLHLVTPGTWKRYFRLTGTDKDAARALAIRLWPAMQGLSRKKDQGRADALLMGLYHLDHNKE